MTETLKAPPRPKWHLPLTDAGGRSIATGVHTFAALRQYTWSKYGDPDKETQAVLHQALLETRADALEGAGVQPLAISK